MKIYTHKELCLPSFSSLSFSGISSVIVKKLFCLFFAVLFLLSAFCVPAAAAGENEDTNVIQIDLSKAVVNLYAVPTTGTVQTIYTPYMERKNSVIGGVAMTGFRSTNADYYKSGRSKNLVVMDMPKIKVDTTYSTSISHAISFDGKYGFKVEVEIWSNGSTKREEIFYEVYSGSGLHTSEFSFSVPSSLVGSSAYSCKLFISNEIISETTTGQDGSVVWQYMQSLIRMTDDDAGWFVKILNAIKAIPDKLRGYFAALGDAISGLGDKIGGFFTDLKNNVSEWFSEQLAKLQEMNDNIKQWFIELGDKIKGFFVDLYNNIVEGLKKLFIPSDGFFEEKANEIDDFLYEHFGVLYQVPSLIISIFYLFFSFKPEANPSIHMPEMEINFKGEIYKLSDSFTLDFNEIIEQWNLSYFHDFYMVFVSVLLTVFFINYCMKKYNEVMGVEDE